MWYLFIPLHSEMCNNEVNSWLKKLLECHRVENEKYLVFAGKTNNRDRCTNPMT